MPRFHLMGESATHYHVKPLGADKITHIAKAGLSPERHRLIREFAEPVKMADGETPDDAKASQIAREGEALRKTREGTAIKAPAADPRAAPRAAPATAAPFKTNGNAPFSAGLEAGANIVARAQPKAAPATTAPAGNLQRILGEKIVHGPLWGLAHPDEARLVEQHNANVQERARQFQDEENRARDAAQDAKSGVVGALMDAATQPGVMTNPDKSTEPVVQRGEFSPEIPEEEPAEPVVEETPTDADQQTVAPMATTAETPTSGVPGDAGNDKFVDSLPQQTFTRQDFPEAAPVAEAHGGQINRPKNLPRYKLTEHKAHLVVDFGGGKTNIIQKSAYHPAVIAMFKRFADGGEVTPAMTDLSPKEASEDRAAHHVSPTALADGGTAAGRTITVHKEHPHHFEVSFGDSKPFRVAKKAMHPLKVKAFQTLAKDGAVQHLAGRGEVERGPSAEDEAIDSAYQSAPEPAPYVAPPAKLTTEQRAALGRARAQELIRAHHAAAPNAPDAGRTAAFTAPAVATDLDLDAGPRVDTSHTAVPNTDIEMARFPPGTPQSKIDAVREEKEAVLNHRSATPPSTEDIAASLPDDAPPQTVDSTEQWAAALPSAEDLGRQVGAEHPDVPEVPAEEPGVPVFGGETHAETEEVAPRPSVPAEAVNAGVGFLPPTTLAGIRPHPSPPASVPPDQARELNADWLAQYQQTHPAEPAAAPTAAGDGNPYDAQIEANTQAQATAAQDIAAQQKIAADARAAQQAQQVADQQAWNGNFQTFLDQRNKATDDLIGQVNRREIDPNRFWHSLGPAGQAGMALAQAMGTFGSALSKTPNYAFQMLKDSVDNDISAQEKNLDSQHSLLRTYLDQTKNMTAAKAMTRAAMLDVQARQLEILDSQKDSAMANPVAQMAIAKMREQSTKDKMTAAASFANTQQTKAETGRAARMEPLNTQLLQARIEEDKANALKSEAEAAAKADRAGASLTVTGAPGTINGLPVPKEEDFWGGHDLSQVNIGSKDFVQQFGHKYPVKLPNGLSAIADTPKAKADADDVLTASRDVLTDLADMSSLARKNGWTVWGSQNDAAAKAAQAKALSDLNHLEKVQRLSGVDISKVLMPQLPNPGQWAQWQVNPLLNLLKSQVQAHRVAVLSQLTDWHPPKTYAGQ
ncbi:MAG: hypothetical protein ACHQ5A_02375 [Opitutales bacterium]